MLAFGFVLCLTMAAALIYANLVAVASAGCFRGLQSIVHLNPLPLIQVELSS